MTKTRLSAPAEQLFIDEGLVQDWDPAGAYGYDVDSQPGDEDFIAVGRSLDDVGEVHPQLIVQRTNETSPGGTTYNFLAPGGPGQDRTGQLLVTARAEDTDAGYTGDSNQYTAVDADDLVDELINEVEDVCLRNANPTDTEISPLGSYRGADAPDEFGDGPTVRVEQCIVTFSWQRLP